MHEIITQKFLRENGLDALVDQFKIKIRRHNEFPNLVQFKYDQIESPHHPIVCQCRGLILNEAEDWNVVSYPFDRFFNYGDSKAAKIDWNTAQVQDKCDGSLMVLWHYAGKWRVSSSGLPDASGNIYGTNLTFAQLFWDAWEEMGWKLPHNPSRDHIKVSYMFEMMTPFNRIVVPYTKTQLVLIGCRRLDDFKEVPVNHAAIDNGWESVKSYPLQTINEVINAARNLSPAEGEGYVIVDYKFNRIKLKSEAYVALAHAKDSCGPSKLIDLIRQNESDEFLSYFPSYKDAFDYLARKYKQLCDNAQAVYEENKHHVSQKDFAVSIKDCRASAALFAMRDGKVSSVREFYSKANLNALEKALDYNTIEIMRLLGKVEGVASEEKQDS